MKTLREKADAVLSKAFRGLHNVPGTIRDDPKALSVYVNVYADLSTFDFDTLTRLVVMAHDECVRLSVKPSGPRLLKLVFHDRQREGDIYYRHPTIEEAIANYRA